MHGMSGKMYGKKMSYSNGGKKPSKMGGMSGHTYVTDQGKAPNWDGKKQGPSTKNKGFGSF